MTTEFNGYTFDLTCGACPEQYDVYKDDKQIAYVRLRWGRLTVEVPDIRGYLVYAYDFDNDCFKGCFDSDDERDFFLNIISLSLSDYYRETN